MLGDPDIFHEGNWLVPFFVEPSKRPNSKSVAMRLKIHQIGREIKRLAKHHPYWQTRIWLKIHELVILMIEEWDWKHKVAPINNHMRILPAIQFLRNNINKNISVEDAAKICSMSRSRFSALFTATIGKSFANFSLNARISEAAKKLRTSNLPIKMIAQQCGFSDISHFYRVFKKFFKCTPVEYRAGK
jgi:AraC-like DNA-binding protein